LRCFYLRSVAPAKEFVDRLTGRRTAPVTTGQIYWGAVPFVIIQIIMVALIIAFPDIVSGGLKSREKINTDNIRIEVPLEEAAPAGESGGAAEQQDDVQKALERSMKGRERARGAAADTRCRPRGAEEAIAMKTARRRFARRARRERAPRVEVALGFLPAPPTSVAWRS
jgi:hypothetical protein